MDPIQIFFSVSEMVAIDQAAQDLKTTHLGKGCDLRILEDTSKPRDLVYIYYVEYTYDGKEDSDMFEVPYYWYQVYPVLTFSTCHSCP
jgi:hypothetical protein